MAGQHPSRRQVLEALGFAAVAASADGFCHWQWAFAQAPAHHTHMSPSPGPVAHPVRYRPVLFTVAQYRTVEVLAELILPATHPPLVTQPTSTHHAAPAHGRQIRPADAGATDAGVAEFIDFMVSQDAALQPKFHSGLAWMDKAAGGSGFVALPPAEQTALLQRLAYKKNFQPGEEAGQEFFLLMRKYTVMGFYTSRIGMESLDYPGLRFYAESPSVPQDAFLQGLGV